MPDGTPLFRAHRGILENLFLELVNAHEIRHVGKAASQMGVAVFVRVFPEEQLHPGVGPVFHSHGVDLRHLRAGMALLHERQRAIGSKALERVARFVGQDVHVGAGAVEIRENEGHFDTRERRAITTALLARLGLEIKHLILDHPVEKAAGLGRQFAVHLLCRRDQFLSCPAGNSITFRIGQELIVILQLVNTQVFPLLFEDLRRDRRDLVPHLFTECLRVL